MQTQNEQFPSAPQALLVLLALLVTSMVVGAALYDFRQALDLSPNEMDAFVVFFSNAIVFTIVMHLKGLSYRSLFHNAQASLRSTLILLVPPIALLIPAMVLFGTSLVTMLIALFPLSPAQTQMFGHLSEGNLASVVTACVLAPVLEEMLFRGIILRAFLHQYSRWQAILGSALLFGLAHLNIYQFFIGLGVGILSGWLYERTRSLGPCIALHAFYNSALILLDLTIAEQAVAKNTVLPMLWWGLAFLSAGIGMFVLQRLLRGKPA